MSIRRAPLLVAAVIILASPTGASAAVTLGNDYDGASLKLSTTCPTAAGCASINETAPGHPTKSPISGVIVRWSVRGEGDFQVFPVTYVGDDTIARGKGTKVRTATSTAKVSAFAARTPIKAGEYVGLLWHQNATILSEYPAAGADADTWNPAPAVGETAHANASHDGNWVMAYAAVIEPDADGDGFGDETQDACPANAAVQSACPALPAAPAPPPASPPAPPADTVAPVFARRPSMRPGVFSARRGARLHLSISEPARVTIVVERRGGRGYRRVGNLVRRVGVGPVAVLVRRRVGAHSLRRGRYLAVVRAVDAAGNASTQVHVRFRVR